MTGPTGSTTNVVGWLSSPLAEQAAARIGLDGEANPGAAPAGELETIFSVGVQDPGQPLFDLLLDQANASEDPQFRQSAVGALARVEATFCRSC